MVCVFVDLITHGVFLALVLIWCFGGVVDGVWIYLFFEFIGSQYCDGGCWVKLG